MPKALIEPGPEGRVCLVAEEEFPVSPEFKWVDCPPNVKPEFVRKGGVFTPPPGRESQLPDPDPKTPVGQSHVTRAMLQTIATVTGTPLGQVRAAFAAAWDSV